VVNPTTQGFKSQLVALSLLCVMFLVWQFFYYYYYLKVRAFQKNMHTVLDQELPFYPRLKSFLQKL
jgi:hypothetical protein